MKTSNAGSQACDHPVVFAVYRFLISGLMDTQMKNLFPSLLKTDNLHDIPVFHVHDSRPFTPLLHFREVKVHRSVAYVLQPVTRTFACYYK